jgi:hypothetical protein
MSLESYFVSRANEAADRLTATFPNPKVTGVGHSILFKKFSAGKIRGESIN